MICNVHVHVYYLTFSSAMTVLFFCSFRTGKGIGYSAHFSGPMLVLECTVKTGKRENKVLHHLVKFEFHPQKVIKVQLTAEFCLSWIFLKLDWPLSIHVHNISWEANEYW